MEDHVPHLLAEPMHTVEISLGKYYLWTGEVPAWPVIVSTSEKMTGEQQRPEHDSIAVLRLAKRNIQRIWVKPRDLSPYDYPPVQKLLENAHAHNMVQTTNGGYPDLKYWEAVMAIKEPAEDDCMIVEVRKLEPDHPQSVAKDGVRFNSNESLPCPTRFSKAVTTTDLTSRFGLRASVELPKALTCGDAKRKSKVEMSAPVAKKTCKDVFDVGAKSDHHLNALIRVPLEHGQMTIYDPRVALPSEAHSRLTDSQNQARIAYDDIEELSSVEVSSDETENEEDEEDRPVSQSPPPNVSDPFTQAKIAAKWRRVLNNRKVTLMIGGGLTSSGQQVPSKDFVFDAKVVESWGLSNTKTKDPERGYVIKSATWSAIDPRHFSLIHDIVTEGDFAPHLVDWKTQTLCPKAALSDKEKRLALTECTYVWRIASHRALANIMEHVKLKIEALRPIPYATLARSLGTFFKDPLHDQSMEADKGMRKVLEGCLEEVVDEIKADMPLLAHIRDKKRCSDSLSKLLSHVLDKTGTDSSN
ncbi:hypothetical protein EJ05DRAFT_483421 [Pseudovirgaria hyperparasitica]|uniref:Uncharacterized protein n=1 Tax=Pseudovirgaria hyperparasitica TaxID=470096 RepID=A0A6A6WFQ1_9PEZI|nr:uncharacterized protein EJ05DRAFT_483421 [Pseudovirgaria hyperparasitica]KAF2760999.1 hypothetical protein EJ05DRAFT_483421 [Pseudovirgaria hyperparasitica]